MCIVCTNPRSSQDDLEKAAAKHKRDALQRKAIQLKELIEDCNKVLRIHASAGTRDAETERFLESLRQAQFELSREM